MLKFSKIINNKTNQVDVGLGNNTSFYLSLGMTEQEVEQGQDGCWYLLGFGGCCYVDEEGYPTNEITDTYSTTPCPDKMCYQYVEGGWVLDKTKQLYILNRDTSLKREQAYATQIDPLHARKQRKLIIGTWTEEDEATYVAEVKLLSTQIELENPYMEDIDA